MVSLLKNAFFGAATSGWHGQHGARIAFSTSTGQLLLTGLHLQAGNGNTHTLHDITPLTAWPTCLWHGIHSPQNDPVPHRWLVSAERPAASPAQPCRAFLCFTASRATHCLRWPAIWWSFAISCASALTPLLLVASLVYWLFHISMLW